MNGKEPAFKWDQLGISAYGKNEGKVNTKEFVRFDKNGIYGINNADEIDGASWGPESLD
jgi:hypothetical protein